MKVWITKYALTYGIVVTRAAQPSVENPKYITTPPIWPDISMDHQTFGPLDWHVTKEAAVRRANTMKTNKIKRLTKQVHQLAELEIKIVENTKGEPDESDDHDPDAP